MVFLSVLSHLQKESENFLFPALVQHMNSEKLQMNVLAFVEPNRSYGNDSNFLGYDPRLVYAFSCSWLALFCTYCYTLGPFNVK